MKGDIPTPMLWIFHDRCSIAVAMQDCLPTLPGEYQKQPTRHILTIHFVLKKQNIRYVIHRLHIRVSFFFLKNFLEKTPVEFLGQTLQQMHAGNTVAFAIQSRANKTNAELSRYKGQYPSGYSTFGGQTDLDGKFA